MIGVFDSGLGGLTVLKALAQALPHEDFIYLGDTARLPYGTKSGDTIRKYSQQNLHFLKNQKVKALVIACNSASANWTTPDFEGLPVFTVIEPASLIASQRTQNKRVGLLATRATVASGAFQDFMKQLDPEITLYAQAAPLLVPLAEEGLREDPLTNLVAYRYVQPLVAQGIDTLILGCTHYPILHSSIARAAGPEVQLVESGSTVALELKKHLQEQGLLSQSNQRQIRIFTTDTLGHFKSWAESILTPIQAHSWELTDL